MFTKLFSALLFAIGAMVDGKNCCALWEAELYMSDYLTLCYATKDEPSTFNLEDLGIGCVGSFSCGSETEFRFCEYSSSTSSTCINSAGQ